MGRPCLRALGTLVLVVLVAVLSARAAEPAGPGTKTAELEFYGWHLIDSQGRVERRTSGESEPRAAIAGESLSPGDMLSTGPDGQCTIGNHLGDRLRLKEDSQLLVREEDWFHLESGHAGLLLKGNSFLSVKITTPLGRIAGKRGILIVKLYRFCLRCASLAGDWLLARGPVGRVLLAKGRETAIAGGEISRDYAITNELRYAWYW